MNHLIKSFILIVLCVLIVSINSYAEEQITSQEPEKTAEYWFNLGEDYYNVGKYKDALDAFNEAIEIQPDYAKAYAGLGLVYTILGKHQDAVNALNQAIKLKPDEAVVYYGIGNAYNSLGKYDEAINAYKQTIKIKSDFVEAYVGLGLVYHKLEKYQESIDAYKQVLNLDSDDKNIRKLAHYSLGIIYIISNDKDSALREYEILKDLDPQLANKLLEEINKQLFGNNSAAIDNDVEVSAQADLIVTEYRGNQDLLVYDTKDKIEVIVSIKNIGTSSTADSLSPEGHAVGSRGECKALVEFTDDNPKTKEWQHFCRADVPALAAGATHTFSCKVEVSRAPPFKYSNYKFRITVDTLNWIDESHEWNNSKIPF